MNDEWISRLRVGDVIRAYGSGDLRVIRTVNHTQKHTFVSLAIRHCSWTGRCYTILNQNDLRQRYSPTNMRVTLVRRIDRKFIKAVTARERPGSYSMTCCDVQGLS